MGLSNRRKNSVSVMDVGARNWLIKTAKQNYWRVACWYELEDLIQDGYVCYAKVIQRYPKAQTAKHVMALFQITFTNHITDLAKATRRYKLEVQFDELPPKYLDQVLEQNPCPYAELLTLISELPLHLRKLIQVMFTEADKIKMPRVRSQRGRENCNELLCRLVGLDPDIVDLHGELVSVLRY